ncbi:hypothetical protein EHW36_24995 [Salmonella enterica]|nr:hypothetical protein [Salmonella enterica]
MFAGKKSAQIREILISESAWEEMTCLFAPSLTLFACNQFSLVPYCYPAIQRGFQSGVLKEIVPFYREQKLGILAMEIMARERGDTINWEAMQVRVDPVYLDFCQNILLSSNDELVRTGLITLCDKHLEWTDFHNSDKHCCLTGYEIQRQDLLLWPFEYQAVKNWRARQGLSTPMIEHPLMNSPMTTANCPDFSQWQRPEWFNPLVDFLAQRRPELAFLRHLFI